jgi:cytochrome-b5 reductase
MSRFRLLLKQRRLVEVVSLVLLNLGFTHPFGLAGTKICMLVGGTGITPMIQALHATLGDAESDTEVVMLYGSRVSSDILGKELVDSWAKDHKDRFKVVHILSDEPADTDWTGPRGFIDAELIKSNFPDPSAGDDIMFMICGPPPLYNALSGPRDQKELTGLLADMGYKAEQVVC